MQNALQTISRMGLCCPCVHGLYIIDIIFNIIKCYDMNVCHSFPPNSYVEILTSKSDCIRRLDLWEVIRS